MADNQSGTMKGCEDKMDRQGERVELRSYAAGDEKGITEILAACHAKGWEDEEFWRWKHSHRPGFSADDVTLAVVDNQLAGCFHGALLPLRLEEGIEVPMCFEGDFAVLPQYRKAGLPVQAHDLADQRLLSAGAILRGGFTSQQLNERFYHKQFGYIFAPTVTVNFRKVIGFKPLQDKVAVLCSQLLAHQRIRRALKGKRLVINLTIGRLPSCHLDISEQEGKLCRGFVPGRHLHAVLSYSLLVAAKQNLWSLLRAVLWDGARGRLRIGGIWGNAIQIGTLLVRLVRP